VLDSKLATRKRSEQVDLDLGEQVRVFPLEPVVWFLLDDDDDIPGGNTWRLVALTAERDRLAALHTLVDVDLEHLLLRDDLLAIARLALVLVVDNLARTRALVARLLDLLNHRPHLAHHNPDTAPATALALAHGTLLATFAVALGTDDVPR
jgi:hypothetical protein